VTIGWMGPQFDGLRIVTGGVDEGDRTALARLIRPTVRAWGKWLASPSAGHPLIDRPVVACCWGADKWRAGAGVTVIEDGGPGR
jgi:hypothetical protein